MVTCNYCKRSQDHGTGGCVSCGAPLPRPVHVTTTRRIDITRDLIDVTTFGDIERKFIARIPSGVITEVKVEER